MKTINQNTVNKLFNLLTNKREQSNNLQETHLKISLKGNKIQLTSLCINQYGSAYHNGDTTIIYKNELSKNQLDNLEAAFASLASFDIDATSIIVNLENHTDFYTS